MDSGCVNEPVFWLVGRYFGCAALFSTHARSTVAGSRQQSTTNLPLVSGTMALGKTIQSYGTLAINGNLMEDICNSARAA